MNDLKHFKIFKNLCLTLFISTLIFSCSTQPNSTKKQTRDKTTQRSFEEKASVADYLAQAKNRPSEESLNFLIKASQLLVEEHNFTKALWLATQCKELATQKVHKQQLALISATSLSMLGQNELALTVLASVDINDEITPLQLFTYYDLLANIQFSRDLPLVAMDAKLRAFSLNPSTNEQLIKQIWGQLNELSQWQIDQLVALKPPYMKGWQQLLNFAHHFGYQRSSFQRYLTQWERNFPTHPAIALLAELRAMPNMPETKYQNIAVILPLSGKQKNAGESAQHGILAAFNNNTNKSLHFIDSNQLDVSTLAERFTELNIDYVIGPLLKSSVDAYIHQTEIWQPTLLLNLPIKQQIAPHHMVLSMDPKDEAIQAATTLSRQNFRHPIIYSQSDSVSQRIANTFASQWQKITGELPETIFFNGENGMQDQLKSSLGIKQSDIRIKEIDKRIRQKLKTEERNRRDIDMIYLVGSPNETRLLKPYIDVNISPFAKAVPIFASSRSHSDNADSSDNRDLTGLKFTEMPWLLKSKQQNTSLKALNEQIWPEKNDSLKRIFAMGYDSLSLIDKFQAFKHNPYIRHFGQTGIIQMNKDGILTRSLLWGSYQKDKVEEIAMD